MMLVLWLLICTSNLHSKKNLDLLKIAKSNTPPKKKTIASIGNFPLSLGNDQNHLQFSRPSHPTLRKSSIHEGGTTWFHQIPSSGLHHQTWAVTNLKQKHIPSQDDHEIPPLWSPPWIDLKLRHVRQGISYWREEISTGLIPSQECGWKTPENDAKGQDRTTWLKPPVMAKAPICFARPKGSLFISFYGSHIGWPNCCRDV
jgi:hypothetical protein